MSVWASIKSFAPTLAAAAVGSTGILSPFAPLVHSMVADALGVDDDEAAVTAALESDPAASQIALSKLEQEQHSKITLYIAETERLVILGTQETARAELSSGSEYIARWRPYFGYKMADCFSIQVAGSTITVFMAVFMAFFIDAVTMKDVTDLVVAMGGMIGSTIVLWTMVMGVMGVSVHSRSKDKAVSAGVEQKGLFTALVERVSKKGLAGG